MSRYGCFQRATRLAIMASVLYTICLTLRADTVGWPSEMLDDAELTDVVFVDRQRGWAIGDRGVIWFSSDGGHSWQLQTAPCRCRLEAIQFLNTDEGWIVGSLVRPYSHKPGGVVLRTRDRGRHWQSIGDATLPALKRIKMIDGRHGWALGHSSELYPEGVFRTEDGGRTWSSIPAGTSQSWLTGDFRDARHGAVAGRNAQMATVRITGLSASKTPSLGMRHLRDMKLVKPSKGWLVGDGGLVMITFDDGLTWQTPQAPIPGGAGDHFDFHAIATIGDQCWIAGAPGTCIFHSPDAGRTWQTFRTAQNLPLLGLHFLDESHGWAVGAMGTILATEDGGRSWRTMRSGGTRAALLAIYSEPVDIPLEFFAQFSAGEGYLGAVEVLCRRDVEISDPDSVSMAERTHHAVVAVGGSAAGGSWRFPLRQRGLGMGADRVLEGWNRSNDGHGAARLEAHVVRRIRQWRPDVVFTHSSNPQGSAPVAHLVNQVVLSAVEKAADPTRYTELSTIAALDPWKVTKVFGTLDPNQTGSVNITSAKLVPPIGQSVEEITSRARSYLLGGFDPGPALVGCRLLTSSLPRQLANKAVFSGISLSPGGDARRRSSSPTAVQLDVVRRRVQKRRNLQQLLARSENDSLQGAGWIGQVGDLTQGLEPLSAGEILYQLAYQYHQSGKPDLAATTFEMLAERYPDHPLTPAAQVWLIQFLSSNEAAWRQRGQTQFAERQVRFDADVKASGPPNGRRQSASSRIEVHRSSGRKTATTDNEGLSRVSKALSIGKVLESNDPSLYAEPGTRFPLAVAYRRSGMSANADRYFRQLASRNTQDAWRDCALTELWLNHGRGLPPKRIAKCSIAAEKPVLNGRLDDTIWREAHVMQLSSVQHDDTNWPAAAMIARDEEYLYLGASCRLVTGVSYPTNSDPRTRDAEISGRDRVDVCIDVDRDYASYYRLSMDHRGWTNELCFGDTNWDPEWFVAAATRDGHWVVEAAIPLSELSADLPETGDAWAVGVQRTVPGMGFQSWTKPASVEVLPQGFGLIIFD